MAESDSGAFVREVLDHAIASVAEEEYCRLAEGMSLKDQTVRVDNALGSLMELQKGNEPNYDSEWVSLFYLTWFQPRQVHLAYAALRQHIGDRKPPQQVIDYGCGAWAVQFALAILLAEKEELQGSAVYGIDPNEPMREIGKRLWVKLRETVENGSSGQYLGACLYTTLGSMEESCSYHASLADAVAHLQPAPVSGPDCCWFTALHAIYEANRIDLKGVFDRVREEPTRALAVARFREFQKFYGTGSRPDWAPFFTELRFSRAELNLAWSGVFLETTRWRKNLVDRLPDLHWLRKSLLRKYSVSWDPLDQLDAGQHVVMIRSGAQ